MADWGAPTPTQQVAPPPAGDKRKRHWKVPTGVGAAALFIGIGIGANNAPPPEQGTVQAAADVPAKTVTAPAQTVTAPAQTVTAPPVTVTAPAAAAPTTAPKAPAPKATSSVKRTTAPTKPKATATRTRTQAPAAYYKNCSAARAAGVAPLHRGDPGYRAGLDRDGDGIACE